MKGLMQDRPLALPDFFDRAEQLFADKELVSATAHAIDRSTYKEWAERTRRLGGVLEMLELSPDARVATFAWNSSRHLELYFAAPCSGRVLHTLNIRLFPDQLTYVANHAEDEAIFVDRSLLGLLAPLLPTLETVRHVVVMNDTDADAPEVSGSFDVHEYESLLASAEPVEWRVDDENQAASMCYTSGTTGNPKGVVYSHRSTWLHTAGVLQADNLGICERDVILPVVPMFHANAWGLAHAAVAAGSKVVFPGPRMQPPQLADLIESERVTVAAGVPTIWMGVLPELAGRDVSSLRAIPCGGSSVPKTLSEGYREAIGLPILQAWGMTETSPLGSVGHIKSTLEHLDDAQKADLRTAIGLPVVGVQLRIVSAQTGEPVAHDGEASGEIQVSGPWIAASYYNDDRSPESFTDDGWLRTGDVASIDANGYVRIVDRTKDVVKSGGEWVSSVELENEIMAHPAVAEAAVIGVSHPKWGERPLACVVLSEGSSLTLAELHEWLDGRVAKWWLPDDMVIIDEVPKTSVGKFSKKTLRDRFADHTLPVS